MKFTQILALLEIYQFFHFRYESEADLNQAHSIGKALVKHWQIIGKALVKHWQIIGKALANHW